MNKITEIIGDLSGYQSVLDRISDNISPVSITGLSLIHTAHLACAIFDDLKRPVFIITPNDGDSEKMSSAVSAFFEKQSVAVLSRELNFHNIEGISRQYEHKRITALGSFSKPKAPVCLSIASALTKTIPRKILKDATFTIKSGENSPLNEIIQKLVVAGYRRAVQVEGVGQFSVRGGILDIFPPSYKAPTRIEFWGDDIDSMSFFDIDSQRRGASIDTLTCLPNCEVIPSFCKGSVEALIKKTEKIIEKNKNNHPDIEKNLNRDIERMKNDGIFPSVDKYLPLIYEKSETPIDYFPKNAIVLLYDTARIHETANNFALRMGEDITSLEERGLLTAEFGEYSLSYEGFIQKIEEHSILCSDSFIYKLPGIAPKAKEEILAKEISLSSLSSLVSQIKEYRSLKYKIVILSSGSMRQNAVLDMLNDNNISAKISEKLPNDGEVCIMDGFLPSGIEYPKIKFVVLSEGQSVVKKQKSKKKKKSNRDAVKSFSDLIPGDVVVHEHHGIGRFIGIDRIEIDGSERDFIKIAFAGKDFLYVPATSLDLISKYIGAGGENKSVRLNKLGGTDWQKSKARAKAATKELAQKLIALYAERQKVEGFKFPDDDVWQEEFEEAFPYEETDDQIRCTEEIKNDMMSTRPMDRLLCGDVGFGKTEVALRAVMKCVMAGKQAAILVPTTVLAKQHYLTALERFLGYPVIIDVLSRYRTKGEENQILERLKVGKIDLLIGTHKLFAKAIKFHDLGLLVIDEEQRFGVSHKEKLKEISKNIDVLTLSATPIPRTLNMALSGIRDMSILEEPPQNRHPVQTYVLEYNFGVLSDAIKREFYRGGQCYYVHNNVSSIDSVAIKIKTIIPEAVVAVAHGKMGKRELNSVMTKMTDGEIDILVCTTIIETGIDIPNANTLIVENADKMGLSQLHQIRGRVGRSSRHAYAYFTFKTGKALSEVSQKRLSAVREFAEFGSGFKIAMRDLEIRGAGNILGPEQSGHLLNIGYDLYLKLLEEAVLEEKGEKVTTVSECLVELPVPANLSDKYIADAGQRIDLYRRIALVRSEEDKTEMIDELIDRYGEPPTSAINLCDIAILRTNAASCGITEIKMIDNRLIFTFSQADFPRLSTVCAIKEYKGRLLLNAGSPPYLSLRMEKNEKPLISAKNLVLQYSSLEMK